MALRHIEIELTKFDYGKKHGLLQIPSDMAAERRPTTINSNMEIGRLDSRSRPPSERRMPGNAYGHFEYGRPIRTPSH